MFCFLFCELEFVLWGKNVIRFLGYDNLLVLV